MAPWPVPMPSTNEEGRTPAITLSLSVRRECGEASGARLQQPATNARWRAPGGKSRKAERSGLKTASRGR
eukprot:438833-Lingulodinium_polyedra.AAC.1